MKGRQQSPVVKNRRPFLLLEVLIALVIVAFAVLPLIYPHYHIYQQQKLFSNKLRLDLTAGHLYANILQKLHQNEIPWQNIEQQTHFPIDKHFLEGLKNETLPYRGFYKFQIKKQKKNEKYGLYRIKLIIEMTPTTAKQKIITFNYEIFISRLFAASATSNQAVELNIR